MTEDIKPCSPGNLETSTSLETYVPKLVLECTSVPRVLFAQSLP